MQVKVPGKIACVMLSNDKDQTTLARGTAATVAAVGREPLYTMTLAQLQRFMYNLSQESVRDRSMDIPLWLWGRNTRQLTPEFFDSTTSDFGIKKVEDLPEKGSGTSVKGHISIEEWLKTLKREGDGPSDSV